jgi:hypothetical protein
MMDIATIFARDATVIGGITFDCTFKETVNATYESSDYAVENKSIMSDHVRRMPKMVTIEVAISDAPPAGYKQQLIGTAVGAIASQLPPIISEIGSATAQVSAALGAPKESRSAEAVRRFLELADKCQTFDVVTQKNVYKNMAVTSVTQETTEENETTAVLTIELKEIRVFESEIDSLVSIDTRSGSYESVDASSLIDRGTARMELLS